MKKEVNNKEDNSKNLFDKKNIIIASMIVLAIIVGVVAVLLLNKKANYTIVEVEPTISILEDGTYYIFGASKDISFELERQDDFSYEIKDEEDKLVDVNIKEEDSTVTINAPEELYQDGKNYTLTINNGTFTNEELKEAKVVSFSIVRESKQESKIKEEVKILSNIEIKDKEFNSDEELNMGDIIIIDNNAYKINEKNNDSYKVSIPKLEEVYDEMDYYGSAVLDLNSIEGNKELEDYLTIYANKVILPKLIMDVEAASNVKITTEYNKKEKAMIAKFHFETSPNDKVFNKSFLKYHRLEFDYEVKLSLTLNYDIKLPNVDVNLSIEVQNTPSVKLSHASETLDGIKDGLKEYCKSENVLKNLKKDYKEIGTDKKSLDQNVGTLSIPTPITGLNVELNIGLIMEFDVKANLGATLTNTNTATLGFSTKKGIYGNLRYNNNIDANAFGDASMRLGSNIDAGFSILGTLKIKAKVIGGIYGKANVDIKTKINKDELSTTLNANASAGLFATTSLRAEMWNYEAEKVLFDNEVELYNYTLPLKASNKQEDKDNKKDEEAKPVVGTTETTTNKTNNNSTEKTTNKKNEPSKLCPDEDECIVQYVEALKKGDTKKAKSMWAENNYSVFSNLKQTHEFYNNRSSFYTKSVPSIISSDLINCTSSIDVNTSLKNLSFDFEREHIEGACEGHVNFYYCLDNKCSDTNMWDVGMTIAFALIKKDGYWYIFDDRPWSNNKYLKEFYDANGNITKFKTRN